MAAFVQLLYQHAFKNDLHAFKNKFFRHFIPLPTLIAVLSEPIFGWEVAFVLFFKTPHIT